jgi:hypothetical protein
MLKIILCLIFLLVWIIIQTGIITLTMTKVVDSTVRFKIIVYLFALNAASFMCGLFLGLINC